MNLIIDIGNSWAKVAFSCNGELQACQSLETSLLASFLSTDGEVGRCRSCIISSTVDLPAGLLPSLQHRGIRTLCLGADTPLPFANDYHTPRTLGPDRLAAVAGALQKWPGECVLVIDAGSCVTYELLLPNAHYAGGNIAPGLRMRFAAMHEHTAHLPLIDPDGELPDLGFDTPTAMRAGAVRGLQYEIEGYIHYLKYKYGSVRVVLTGGDSELLKNLITETVEVDRQLVLRGLDYILLYNEENA